MKSSNCLVIFLALLFFASCKSTPEVPKQDPPEETTVKEWKPEDTRSLTGYFAKRGLIKTSDKATDGYILFNPSASTYTYLLNKKGEVVHSWKGELNSMQAYLKENGNLLRLERDIDFPVFAAGGQSGRMREYTWDGKMIWDFEYATAQHLTHHDMALMPNGNILAIAYEVKTKEEAIAAGRDPEHVPPAGIWPDKIMEIKPTLPEGGEILWEWRMWDHLIQDLFPKKANYGKLNENPRKLNINNFEEHGGPPMTAEQIEGLKKAGIMTSNASVENRGSDITHTNSVFYNEKLDQILFSVPGYSEVFIIDHSTTTEQAKGSTGGRWGHGGDLLFRWGNPQNYGRGGPDDQKLYSQHDARWIPEGYPGAGNIMVFNNDVPVGKNNLPSAFAALGQANHPDPQVSIADFGNISSVLEIKPLMDDKGAYILPDDGPFGQKDPAWEYTAPDKYSFFSPFVSGAHRLKNGNTMILSGAQGRWFEIDKDKKIVWEYWNPFFDNYKLPDGSTAQPIGPFVFAQFRIAQYDTDFAGFSGKQLKAITSQPKPYIPEPVPEQKKEM